MTLDGLLAVANELSDVMDTVVAGIADPWVQTQADWAWYRFGSILVMVRDRGAGAAAASLARGLLEQASYWDWATATGVGAQHLGRWAALEYRRLQAVADDVDDDHIWLGWVLPPGVNLAADAGHAVPGKPAEAVRRLGLGFEAAVLEPLQFRGLFSANRLLDVLTHGNMAAALILDSGGGQELPESLAAAVVHVAAAGAAAVIVGVGADPVASKEMTRLAYEVARAASAVHRLPLGVASLSQRPAKARHEVAYHAHSDISNMPSAPQSMTDCAARFLDAAAGLVVVADCHAPVGDVKSWLPWASFRLCWGQLQVLRGVVNDQLGRALLPTAARGLFEDGARWDWLGRRASANPSGDSMRAIVADSLRRVEQIEQGLVSDGVPRVVIDDLLGEARRLLDLDPGPWVLPAITEMLASAYPTSEGVNTALPMYSVLSQFVHSTPLSILHLERDTFPSLTAPTYAVAVEASCKGFASVAHVTLLLAGVSRDALRPSLEQLASRLGDVIFEASKWHFLG